MKKVLKIVFALVMSLACLVMATGCGIQPVKEGSEVVVGITDYKPMDYKDANGEWIGFDAELARKTLTELGYTVRLEEIDWDTKMVTLNSGTIDVIWNGMTVTQELKDNILLSDVYLENQQYAVVKVENQAAYTSKDSLIGKKIAVESGSAAEDAIEKITCTKNALTNQNSAVFEVYAGTSDVAIVDYTMAKTLTAEGADYYGSLVMIDLGFEKEEFAIGFRKIDTALCKSVNEKLASYRADGTMRTLAVKYGIENLLIAD